MKYNFGAIDLEYKDDKFIMKFNKPNYTYQYLTIDELEKFWQELMQVSYEIRRSEQIKKGGELMDNTLVLKFHQKFRDLHIHSSMGVDENNISKITDITEDLYGLARQLHWEVYYKDSTKNDVVVEENDVHEAAKELKTKVKGHKPETK